MWLGSRRTKVSLRLPRNFGQPKATRNWGQPLTIEILWSALGNHELGSALINIGNLVSLCTVQVQYNTSLQLNTKCELNVVGLVLRSVIFVILYYLFDHVSLPS